jgi:hypothetical protein
MDIERSKFKEYNAKTSGASAGVAANGVIKRLQFALDTHVIEGGAPSDDPTVRAVRKFIADYRANTLHNMQATLMNFADRKFDMDYPVDTEEPKP